MDQEHRESGGQEPSREFGAQEAGGGWSVMTVTVVSEESDPM
jgi:hypothetical protein